MPTQLPYYFSVKEVSFEQVRSILSTFSKVLPKVDAEKQKDLIHTIINKITVNEGDSPDERSVKDIELFFDASIKNDYVLTYDTAYLVGCSCNKKKAETSPCLITVVHSSLSDSCSIRSPRPDALRLRITNLLSISPTNFASEMKPFSLGINSILILK